MHRKASIIVLSLFLIVAFSSWSVAAKVPAPEKGGHGFKMVSLKEAKKLIHEGAVVIACHSHTNDYIKAHVRGAIHVTVMVPKDHKRIDFPLSEVDFDLALLPKDKNTLIVTYCASSTCWKSYHAARLAVTNGYKHVYWMRDGIKGWARAFYPTVLDGQALLHPLMRFSNSNFAKCLISERAARKLKRHRFVDFRDKAKFKKHHVKGARHVDYDDMFSKPMMEELNKRDNLIIIHDVPEVAGAIALTLKVMDYPRVYILK